MTERVTMSDGQMTSQTMPSAGNVQRSSDYDAGGVTVRGGPAGFSRQAHSVSDLNDNDIIAIDGMEVTTKMARELGLLSQVFDEGLNSGSASQQSPKPEQTVDVVQKSETGNPEYDQAIEGLNASLDEGSIQFEEAQVYDTSLAEIAMAGLQIEHVVETLSGLADGSIAESDVPSDIRAMSTQVEANVRQASETSAISELGRPAFDALSQMAQHNPKVAATIERYALDRLRGAHEGVTWGELYGMLYEQVHQ